MSKLVGVLHPALPESCLHKSVAAATKVGRYWVLPSSVVADIDWRPIDQSDMVGDCPTYMPICVMTTMACEDGLLAADDHSVSLSLMQADRVYKEFYEGEPLEEYGSVVISVENDRIDQSVSGLGPVLLESKVSSGTGHVLIAIPSTDTALARAAISMTALKTEKAVWIRGLVIDAVANRLILVVSLLGEQKADWMLAQYPDDLWRVSDVTDLEKAVSSLPDSREYYKDDT